PSPMDCPSVISGRSSYRPSTSWKLSPSTPMKNIRAPSSLYQKSIHLAASIGCSHRSVITKFPPPHELRTHCMPHRGFPGRFRQRAKRDIVITLISEEACRSLRRATCEQSVRTERIEFCSVDRENILEDQPSTIQTVQIFEH